MNMFIINDLQRVAPGVFGKRGSNCADVMTRWTRFERSGRRERSGRDKRSKRGGRRGRSRNHARAIVDEADEVGILQTPPIPHQPILQSRSLVSPYIEPNTNDQKKSQI